MLGRGATADIIFATIRGAREAGAVTTEVATGKFAGNTIEVFVHNGAKVVTDSTRGVIVSIRNLSGLNSEREALMDIEYDEDVDAAFVWIVPRPDERSSVVANELWPEELKGKIGLLFDAEKRLVGLEVLEASSHLPKALLDGLDS